MFIKNKQQNINVCNIIRYYYLHIVTYKKIISLLLTFLNLLSDLIKKDFSIRDNNLRVNEIINNAIHTLYNNILILLSVQFEGVHLYNISTTNVTIEGYNVLHKYKKNTIEHNMKFFIESLRLQYNSIKHMIKLVINDEKNRPKTILFINNDDSDDYNIRINVIKESVLMFISKLKVQELKYINQFNDLQKILEI